MYNLIEHSEQILMEFCDNSKEQNMNDENPANATTDDSTSFK